MEILSPAGSWECIPPAIRMGADAVYLGASAFSARAAAANFDNDELKKAIEYCHIRNVNVYLAINTLMHDYELEEALEIARLAHNSGIDAFIVQDLGLAYLLKKACPSVKLHASTQMSVHTPMGAKLLYEAGFDRVVLSRELSKGEIEEIVKACPIETEVFVHGALCMSVSGQCYFSAMLGGRSGNRGQCAQTCRLPFLVKGGNGHDLSLKDMSLVKYLRELEAIGVTSAKIEGRMKRPEYVAMAVSACRQSLDNGFTDEETMSMLESVFSRSGFTDGYYTGKRGSEMFGTRVKENVLSADEALFKQIRALYNKEVQKIPLKARLYAQTGKALSLEITDNAGNLVSVQGEICEQAIKVALTKEKALNQLEKTGSTPFYIEKAEIIINDSPGVSLSQINAMRREALEKLENMRIKRDILPFNALKIELNNKEKFNNSEIKQRTVLISCDSENKEKYDMIFVPWDSSEDKLKKLLQSGCNVGIELPRGMFSIEKRLLDNLKKAKSMGVNHVLVGNLGAVAIGKEAGMTIHGDFGLNVMNSYALLFLKELGVSDAVVSFELTYGEISRLCHHIPIGMLSSGYIPLMLTRNCPNKNSEKSCADCGKKGYLTDRTARRFPIICNGSCSEILNCVPLKMGLSDIKTASPDFCISRNDAEKLFDESIKAQGVTRGLYARGVI